VLVAPDVPAWLARVGGLPDETLSGGHRKPPAACGPVEGRVIDDTAPTRRRAEGHQRMAFFVSEQRKPLHRSTVNLLLRKYSAAASLPLLAHPHMLRHACGFALADQGADTRLIQDSRTPEYSAHLKYTATNPARFEKLWR
jgi:integrase